MNHRVSFATTQTAYCNPQQLTVEERKALCWYSEDELVPTRDDAREAMRILQDGSGLFRRIPADVCIRGIEKYADAMAKVMGQRRLVQSVLEQQKKCPAEGLANISRYLSQPFKDLARYFANRSLEDDEYLSAPPVVSAASSLSSISSPDSSSSSQTTKLLEVEDGDASDDRSDTTEIPSTVTTKRPLSYDAEEETQTMHAARNVKQRIHCSE
jgi:hypothetical protein